MDIVKMIGNYVDEIYDNKSNLSKINKSVSAIKKSYTMYRKDMYADGKLPDINVTNKLTKLMLSKYDLLKNFDGINETLEYLAQDYENMEEQSDENDFKGKSFDIRTIILGNPGTDSKRMKMEYIRSVINNKEMLDDKIDREDIINILKQQSEKMYQEPEEYQKLINDVVMNYIDEKADELENPEMLDIISDYAKSYKNQSEYIKSKEVYEKALGLQQFKENIQYEEILSEYNQLKEYLSTIEKNFTLENINNLSQLREFVENNFSDNYIDKDIFIKEKRGTRQKGNEEKVNHKYPNVYRMPKELKLEAFEKVFAKHNLEIKEILVGKEEYDSYVILPMANTNISILENFNENINEALYIIKNENIEEVINLTKREAKRHEGVISVNHLENFDSYLSNLNNAIEKMMYDKEKKIESEPKNEYKHETVVKEEKNTISEEIQSDNINIEEDMVLRGKEVNKSVEENQEIVNGNNEERNLENTKSMYEYSIEELIKMENELDKEVEELTKQNEELKIKNEIMQRIKRKMEEKQKLEREIDEKRNERGED